MLEMGDAIGKPDGGIEEAVEQERNDRGSLFWVRDRHRILDVSVRSEGMCLEFSAHHWINWDIRIRLKRWFHQTDEDYERNLSP